MASKTIYEGHESCLHSKIYISSISTLWFFSFTLLTHTQIPTFSPLNNTSFLHQSVIYILSSLVGALLVRLRPCECEALAGRTLITPPFLIHFLYTFFIDRFFDRRSISCILRVMIISFKYRKIYFHEVMISDPLSLLIRFFDK